VTVSAWQNHEISGCAGTGRRIYLLSLIMPGLIRWRALYPNTLFLPEDFLHSTPSDRLHAARLLPEEYALLFENARICASCRTFCRSLIPAGEVEALDSVPACAQPTAGATPQPG
jgi:hypothetical protein